MNLLQTGRKIVSIVLVSAMLFTFCGCGESVSYAECLDDYVKTMPYHDGFTILQLTDIHWSTGTNIGDETYGAKEYLEYLIDEAAKHAGEIDLIEVTGDTFMLAKKQDVISFIDFMGKIGIPYAITWGNHDQQGEYNANWLSKQFLNAPYSLYTEVDNDDVHERSNYIINLESDAGDVVWQLVQLDSGAGYRKGVFTMGFTYDYIRQDQKEWMSAQHERVGEDVPAVCYYHIAQKDYDDAYSAICEGMSEYQTGYYKLEGFGSSLYATSMRDAFVENNVKASFAGHCHANDWTVTSEDGIIYGLGVKSGPELYYGVVPADYNEMGVTADREFDLIGASLVTLCDGKGTMKLEHVYIDEQMNNVVWVEY